MVEKKVKEEIDVEEANQYLVKKIKEKEEVSSVLEETPLKVQLIGKIETAITLLNRNIRHKPDVLKILSDAVKIAEKL